MNDSPPKIPAPSVARTGPWRLFVLLIKKISSHHTLLISSGVAFSLLLAVIPGLVALVSVYGLVASPSDVESNLRPLVEALPSEAEALLIEQLENVTAINTAEITFGVVIGLVGVAWAVSSAVNSLVMGVRIAHELRSPHNWIQGRMYALRLSSTALVSGAAILYLVVALPEMTDRFAAGERALEIGRWPLVVITSMTALSLLYRSVVGHRSGRLPFVSIGGVIGTAAWVLSTMGLDYSYDNIGRLEGTFGTLGAVATLMGWFYLTAFAALLGAEIDALLHDRVRIDRPTEELLAVAERDWKYTDSGEALPWPIGHPAPPVPHDLPRVDDQQRQEVSASTPPQTGPDTTGSSDPVS